MRIPPAMTEDAAKDYQRWLWFQLEKGIEIDRLPQNRWNHDDNMAVQHLGFMIAVPPQNQFPPYSRDGKVREIPELISMQRARTPKQLYTQILEMANCGDALCKKAVAYLIQLKFKNPTHRFLHEIEDAEWLENFKR